MEALTIIIKVPGITKKIRKILAKYPHSRPKAIAKLLFQQKDVQSRYKNERLFYLAYRGLIYTEKWAWNKWLKTEEKGRLLKSLKPSTRSRLLDAHRIEWTFERPLSQVIIERIGREAEKRKPGSRDPKPVGEWYVIPNRNRQREYHTEHLTMRVFPVSGTVRILPGYAMPYDYLQIYVEEAFFRGGLDLEEATELSWKIVPSAKHKTFLIGRVDPFKIDYYKPSLGLTLRADGSHPRHIEAIETFPAWTQFLIRSNVELAENLRVHIDVMKGINKSIEGLNKILKKLEEKLT